MHWVSLWNCNLSDGLPENVCWTFPQLIRPMWTPLLLLSARVIIYFTSHSCYLYDGDLLDL